MSTKRILLISALAALILATVAFFTFSFFKKADAPTVPSIEKNQPSETTQNNKVTPEVLEPLPADNKTAIESEITNIDKEINSAIETDLNDLSDIETSL